MKLEDITFKTPCTVPWDSMRGGGSHVRLCEQCNRQVFNLSSMSRAEAEAFLDENLGSQCVQLWKREDGTVVTAECPALPIPPKARRLAGSPLPRPRGR